MKQFKSVLDVMNHFRDDKTCIEHIINKRWGGKPVCVKCGNMDKIYRIEGGKRLKCSACKQKFSITVGTVFEGIHISLQKAFAAVYLITAHKKGISSCQLARDLGITQKTAWLLLHKIRQTAEQKAPQMLTGITQADESFVGGKNKNRHKDKKVKESQGRSVKDKTPIFGLLNNGQVINQVIPDTKAETLKPIIADMVQKGSIIVTDEWNAYNGLNKDFQHEVIKHNEGEYVTGTGFSTNGLEGYWSLFKRGIYGIYHYASPKHLHRYTHEFSYRYNTRGVTDVERFNNTLCRIDGKLTYKQLIQK